MNSSGKLNICLYSDANFLAVNLLENFLSTNSIIQVVTDEVENWKVKTENIKNSQRFSFITPSDLSYFPRFDYVIFCGGFLKQDLAFKDFHKFNSNIKTGGSKTIALFPFETFSRDHMDRIKGNDNTAIIFLGDLLGPRIDLDSDLLLPSLIVKLLNSRELTLAVGETFYPIFISDAVKTISKWVFSFGPYGKEIFLLGPETSADIFWRENQKLLGDVKPIYSNKIKNRAFPRGYETERLNRPLGFMLSETYKWISLHPAIKTSKKKNHTIAYKVESPKIKVPKKYKSIITLLTIFLLLPFIMLTASAGLFYGAYKVFKSGNDGLASNLIISAKIISYVSEKESMVLSKIPLLGVIYNEAYFTSSFEKSSATLALDAIPLARSGETLFKNILGNDIYDSSTIVDAMTQDLSYVYQDIVDLQSLTNNKNFDKTLTVSRVKRSIDFDKLKNTVKQGKTLLADAPKILGEDKSKTYLVLFQNNMELRPTGGFIGSYAITTFDRGRLADMAVSDVYSADGQLNGHVEPPLPIKNYLGEANWWLRDSNWDPDFPTSAKRAEWFLDKEVGRSVDGVFAIDLEPVKEILKLTGPVFLADYNMDITSENLYEKTQKEVQDNFFPGTHRKASFLTALSQNLLNEISTLSGSNKLMLIRSLYQSLNKRHLQIYLHDSKDQQAISSLGWDGSISELSCGDTCYTGLAGVVEANVGVNKSNYFISRSINVDTSIASDGVTNHLSLSIKNTANPALGVEGRYKTYIRFLVPVDAEVLSLQEFVGQSGTALSPDITAAKDRQEVGILVEILGGDSKTLQLTWKTPLTNNFDSYGLYVRKQAGTGEDSLYVTIRGTGIELKDPRFTLTKEGSYVYNTTLDQDIVTRVTW